MAPSNLDDFKDITQHLEYEEMLRNLPREEIDRSAARFMLVRYRALADFVTFDYHTRPHPTGPREHNLRWQIIAIPLITRIMLTDLERAEREEIAMEESESIAWALASNSVEEALLNEEGDQLTAWVARWKQIVAYYLQRYEYRDRYRTPRMDDIDPNSDDIAVRACEWAGVAVLRSAPGANYWGRMARILTMEELVALNTVCRVMLVELSDPNGPLFGRML